MREIRTIEYEFRRNYLVRHYHISANVKDLPFSLIKNFVAIGHINGPVGQVIANAEEINTTTDK